MAERGDSGVVTPADVRHVRESDMASWHSAICEAFCETRYAPRSDPHFSGEMTFAARGGARMSRIHSSAGRFLRDPQTIKRDGFDSLVLLVSLRGELRLTQGHRALRAREGEALVYRHGAPFEIEFPHPYWAVSLWVDPGMMRRHCPDIVSESATVIRPDTTNGLLALTMVRELCVNAISRNTRDTGRLVGATLDVVSTLGTRPDPAEMARGGWLVEKLEDFLLRNIDDCDLTLDSLVAEAGVSARTLNRLFAERGTTPMRWVLDRRLELAYDVLARAQVRNVTEAAFSFGFKDSSHFSRAFSRKFGMPPTSVLRRG
ncbi:AraC family transcriptional regulator [Celeribacter indicus]|uniref:AraC family transcriptional regulator n=2 Tax=Celeribacter indicus TaxID=1208324 RepID=A0A0B5E1B8_9RHOB|nr:AraC family transcriptional regulator [Celeribacter indicus]